MSRFPWTEIKHPWYGRPDPGVVDVREWAVVSGRLIRSSPEPIFGWGIDPDTPSPGARSVSESVSG